MVERLENYADEEWNEEDSWGLDDDNANEYLPDTDGNMGKTA